MPIEEDSGRRTDDGRLGTRPGGPDRPKRSSVGGLLAIAGRGGGLALLYGGSVVALLLGELRLAHAMASDQFGIYQLVRTLIPLLVVAALLSLDQVQAREFAAARTAPPPLRGNQLRPLYIATGVSLAAGALSYAYFPSFLLGAFSIPLVVLGVAAASLASAGLRAAGRYEYAAFSQQGHRLWAGILFIAGAPLLASADLALFLWGLGALAIAVISDRRLGAENGAQLSNESYRSFRRTGLAFSLSALTLSALDWLDGATLALLTADLGAVGDYALSKLVVFYPLISAGSILGFIALPELSRRRDYLTVIKLRRMMVVAVSLTIPVCLLAFVVGSWLLTEAFSFEGSTRPLIILAIAGAVRLCYVLPSAVVGSVAERADLWIFGAACVVGVGVQFLLAVGLPLPPVDAVAISVLGGAAFRLVASLVIAERAIRRRFEVEAR